MLRREGRTHSKIYAITIISFLLGCDSSGRGRWTSYTEESFGPFVAEFFGDNSCYIDQGAGRLACKWQEVDDSRLRIETTVQGTPTVLMGAILEDRLTLEHDYGVSRWVRSGSEEEEKVKAAIAAAPKTEDGLAFYYSNDYDAAVGMLTAAADAGNPKAQMSLAWLYATAPDPLFQNGEKAVFYANQALKWDKDNYLYWNTLAAAHARSGNFPDAMVASQKAVALSEKSAGKEGRDARTMRRFLDIYEQERSFVVDQGKIVVE